MWIAPSELELPGAEKHLNMFPDPSASTRVHLGQHEMSKWSRTMSSPVTRHGRLMAELSTLDAERGVGHTVLLSQDYAAAGFNSPSNKMLIEWPLRPFNLPPGPKVQLQKAFGAGSGWAELAVSRHTWSAALRVKGGVRLLANGLRLPWRPPNDVSETVLLRVSEGGRVSGGVTVASPGLSVTGAVDNEGRPWIRAVRQLPDCTTICARFTHGGSNQDFVAAGFPVNQYRGFLGIQYTRAGVLSTSFTILSHSDSGVLRFTPTLYFSPRERPVFGFSFRQDPHSA